MNKKAVMRLIKSRLEQVGHGIVFDIIEDRVRQEDSWWHVPVLATRKGKDVPREATVNVYANVEDELEQQHKLCVLFIPAVSEPRLDFTFGRRRANSIGEPSPLPSPRVQGEGERGD